MTATILVIAREFTEGGAAYLALRHLRRMAVGRQIDLLVTGPVSPTLAAELPANVTLARLEAEPGAIDQELLATREAVAAAAHPYLERHYAAVVGSSLFPDIRACCSFSLSRGDRKVLVLLDEGLILPRLSAETRAAMQGAIVAADHLLPVSQGLLETLGRSCPAIFDIPATVIPPPIDEPAAAGPSPFARFPADGLPRVVTVARLSPEKQLRRCVRVHHQLRIAGVEFHWHVVGEGVERRVLEREIAKLRMGDRFHLEGFQPEPRAWMREASLFVLSSRSEGCPTVIREALAEGTPVVSTDVNGARELIDDGVTGVVIPDSEPALAAALGRLVIDAAARQQLRTNLTRSGPRQQAGGETRQLLASLEGGPRPRPAPTVTILIPTYDHDRFIGRAIQSCLMQDHPAIEVVVCDDASTDATGSIARRLSHDPRFRYHRNQENLGRVANYRRALEVEAAGEWVVVLDGDDYFTDPSFISRALAVATLHADRGPLFVQAGHRVVRQAAGGAEAARHPHIDILPKISGESRVLSGGDYLRFVYETGFFTHLGTLYRRDAALRQGFYTSDISSSDMDSLLRLALTGTVVVMNSIAGCWVQHGGNASSNLPLERIEENVRIFRQIAREGAAAGVLEMGRIERHLTRYEARTLAHLFGTTVGRSGHGVQHGLRMMGIMMRVNRRVVFEPELAAAWWRYLRRRAGLSLKNLVAPLRRVRLRPRGSHP